MPSHSCSTPPNHRHVGDPVDTLTGAVFDRKLEFRLTGPLELWWYRHYDSSCNQKRMAYGWGHTHDFDRALHFTETTIVYKAPVGREFEFPRLKHDGDEVALNGFFMRRISGKFYQLSQHGEPSMEFEWRQPQKPARLRRLFRGEDQIVFQYNEAYCLERIIDSMGRSIRVIEEPSGWVTSVSLEATSDKPGMLLVAYEYDRRGNLISTKNEHGHGYAFTYDEANRMLMRRGRKGFRFRFAYDDLGRCINANADDNLYGVSLTYKIPGRLTTVKRADGGEWAYHFDPKGSLTRIVDPLGGEQKFVYDEVGKLAMELDCNNNATRIVYNAAGTAIAKISPLGHQIDLPEDPNAPNPLVHRVAGNPAEYEYGRLLDTESITLPGKEQVRGLSLPWEAESLVFIRSDQGQSSGDEKKIKVGPLGVLWWPKPKAGRIFNDFGKLIQQRDDFGRFRHWTYDPSGNAASQTDFDGGKWLYDYGSWHLLRGLTNPSGSQVRFSHTTNERVASCTDAGGTQSEYGYNQKDQLIEVKRHGVVRDRYVRDLAGNLVAKHTGDGRPLLQLEVGPGNLPTKRILASGDEHTLKYDKSGHCLLAATKKDVVEFAYDDLGNRCLEKRNGQGVEHRFFNGRSPGESIFFKKFIARYDGNKSGTLTITDPGGQKHRIRFLQYGLIEREFSNGSREFSQYDGQGRCLFKCVEHQKSEIWKRRYHWSGEGELRRVEDNLHGEIRHEYDAGHRLRRRVTAKGKTEDYDQDLADNLTGQPGLEGVVLEQGNRLRSVDGWNIEYNDRNHIALRQTPEGPVRYTYDSRDQLISAETPRGLWTAEYDAQNRRTRKTLAGQTTEYYWNSDQLIAEVASDGRLRLYIYADPLAVTPLLFLDYDSISSPPESCRRYFIFTDQIGTPCLIEDENGMEVWRAEIAPFGRADIAPDAKIEFNLRFPGHYFDPELGLHYNRFRYYAPDLGRYLQSDPWGIAGGYNLYAYRSNPLLKVDVRGLGEENAKNGEPCEDEEETAPPGPGTPEGNPTDPQGSGMEQETMAALQQRSQEEQELLVMRDSNEQSAKYQSDPENYAPKGMDCKLKTDPETGLVMNRGDNEGAAAPPGYTWEDGYLTNGNGQRIYGDHDVQGAYTVNPDGSYSSANTNDPDWQQGVNDAIGEPPTMVQHGANDDYVKNGGPGRLPDLDEQFTAFNPDGTVTRIDSVAELKAFYAAKGIPWPYGENFPPPCPVDL
jgi:RHS repeat-associated protein